MEGEDKIVESMRRFANDAKCVEYLKTFKEENLAAAPGRHEDIKQQQVEVFFETNPESSSSS